jgi:outer membrane biosynthesis protein TonB
LDEANNKIINPFYNYIKKYNITNVNYPSKEFDTITEQFTKIIMNVLNSENEYNHTLTKIFVGALLCNSNYDTNKLVEFFSILFSYTRNYISEEKKLIDKLKTKYKQQTKKLIECIANYILNDLSSSQYFSLFRMKDLLDENEINLKDKYIEFLFYYMKKFDDPEAKLEDLKFSLLNDIVPIADTTLHSKAFVNDLFKELELDNNNDENLNVDGDINIDQKENKTTNIEKIDENIEGNIKEKKKDKKEKKKKEKNKDKKNKSKNSSKNKSRSKSKSKSNENTKDNNNKSGTKSKDDIYNPNIENVKDSNIDDKKNKIDNNNVQKNDIQIIKDNNNSNKYSYNLSDKINNDINIFRKDKDIKDNDNKNDLLNKENDKNKINNKENNDDNKSNDENSKKNRKTSMEKNKEDEYILNGSKNEEKVKEEENNKINEKDRLNNDIINNNDTNINNEEDSITEITNDEYNKYIIESINQIQKAIKNKSTDFNELMNGVLNKMSVNGEFYEYINVEDFNEKLVSIGVTLSDLQLSCLCSKYCIPNELRLINKLKFEKSLEDYINGNLKI